MGKRKKEEGFDEYIFRTQQMIYSYHPRIKPIVKHMKEIIDDDEVADKEEIIRQAIKTFNGELDTIGRYYSMQMEAEMHRDRDEAEIRDLGRFFELWDNMQHPPTIELPNPDCDSDAGDPAIGAAEIKKWMQMIYDKLLQIEKKFDDRLHIRDIVIEKIHVNPAAIKKSLELASIHGDILLFKEMYFNVESDLYPFTMEKKSGHILYWKGGKWRLDNNYLSQVIPLNIKTCYIEFCNSTEAHLDRDTYLKYLEHVYKFNGNQGQMYVKDLFKNIKIFLTELETKTT